MDITGRLNFDETDAEIKIILQSAKRGRDDAEKIANALATTFRIDQNQASEKWNLLISNGNPDEIRFLLTSVYKHLKDIIGIDDTVHLLTIDIERVKKLLCNAYRNTNLSFRAFEIIIPLIKENRYSDAATVNEYLEELSRDYYEALEKLCKYIEVCLSGRPESASYYVDGIDKSMVVKLYQEIVKKRQQGKGSENDRISNYLISKITWLTEQPFDSRDIAEKVISELDPSVLFTEILYNNHKYFSEADIVQIINRYCLKHPCSIRLLFHYSNSSNAKKWLFAILHKDESICLTLINGDCAGFWDCLVEEYLSTMKTSQLLPYFIEKINRACANNDTGFFDRISYILDDMQDRLNPPSTITLPPLNIEFEINGEKYSVHEKERVLPIPHVQIITTAFYRKYIKDDKDLLCVLELIEKALSESNKNNTTRELLARVSQMQKLLSTRGTASF